MWDAKLEKCLFGRQEVEVPEILMEDVSTYLLFSCLLTYSIRTKSSVILLTYT